MTPINNVFMLSIDSKLDFDTMKEICLTGHSRVPVYEDVEVSVDSSGRLEKVKKIIGILLVKHVCYHFPASTTYLTLVLVCNARPQR